MEVVDQLRSPALRVGDTAPPIPDGLQSESLYSAEVTMLTQAFFCQKVWNVPIVYSTISIAVPVVPFAWDTPFIGKCDELLWRNIQAMDKERTKDLDQKHRYLNHVSIIQSSGTGKSRMVDEVAKRVFTIPINLRHEDMNPCVYKALPVMSLTNDTHGAQSWLRGWRMAAF